MFLSNSHLVKGCLWKDLATYSDKNQKAMAKLLLMLTDIIGSEDYLAISFFMLDEFKNIVQQQADSLNPATLGIKEAIMCFPLLSGEEIEEIKQFLERFIPKQKDTLEQYLCEKLNLGSKTIYEYVLRSGSQENKIHIIYREMCEGFYEYRTEDFSLDLEKSQKPISQAEIEKLIIQYYANKECTLEENLSGFLVKKNEKIISTITISYSPEKIFITVNDL